MYTIEQVERMPIEEVRNYVRAHIPSNIHYWIEERQLRYQALTIMKENNELDPQDADLMDIPMFGRTYVLSDQDLVKTFFHVGVDMTPGLSHIASVKRLLDNM